MRKRLVLLVYILVNYLRRSQQHVLLKQVREIIQETNEARRSQEGGNDIKHLHTYLEKRLRRIIDDKIWTQVVLCLELYMGYRHNRCLLLRSSCSKLLSTQATSEMVLEAMSTHDMDTTLSCSKVKKHRVSL